MASQSASYNLALLNKLTYKIALSAEGTTGIVPRTCVTVNLPNQGINNEMFYVYSVEHSFSNAGYLTNLDLRK